MSFFHDAFNFIILTINNFLEINAPLSLLIKKEMVTRNQNYSFIEKDPLTEFTNDLITIHLIAQHN